MQRDDVVLRIVPALDAREDGGIAVRVRASNRRLELSIEAAPPDAPLALALIGAQRAGDGNGAKRHCS